MLILGCEILRCIVSRNLCNTFLTDSLFGDCTGIFARGESGLRRSGRGEKGCDGGIMLRKGATPCGGRAVLGAVGQGSEGGALCGSLVLIEEREREIMTED